jgi:hypothetical protein
MRDKVLIDHLKEFHAGSDTSNFNVLDFVGTFGTPLDALAYSKLFWPDFLEFDGMVFLKDFVEDDEDRSRIRRFRAESSTRREVEESFNRFLIPVSFFSKRGQATIEEHIYLGEQMAEMWRARLERLFPDKRFVVELQMPSDDEDQPTIVVYQAQ